jgi:hypothetical protein
MNVLKGIGAVLAGTVAIIVLSVGTDEILRVAGVLAAQGQTVSNALLLLATAYRTVYGIGGGYIAARLAPDRPMLHAVILGTIGVVLCAAAAAATWNAGPNFSPHWYPLTLLVLAIPQSWLGAKLRPMRTGASANA